MKSEVPTKKLDEIVSLNVEKAVGKKDGSRPYVGLEHLASASPDLLGTAAANSSISTNGVFGKDDVLFGKLRPNLRKSLLAPFPGYCSTDILVLRPREGIAPSFAAKVFQSEGVFRHAEATAIGTKMPRTAWSELKGLSVFCPDPFEQNRIAEVLDALDSAIRQTEQVVAKLQQMKQGLLHDLLTRGIDDNGELRDPERHPERFRISPVGRVPKGWSIDHFADFQPVDRPYLKTGPFGSSLKGEHWVERGVPVITIGALGEGKFIESELLYVTERTARRLGAYSVLPGDIVFSRVADVGRSVAVPPDATGWIMSSNSMLISLERKRVGGSMSN